MMAVTIRFTCCFVKKAVAELRTNRNPACGFTRHPAGKALLEPPFRHFAPGREPHALLFLHVLDQTSQGLCPARPAGNVRMELKQKGVWLATESEVAEWWLKQGFSSGLARKTAGRVAVSS